MKALALIEGAEKMIKTEPEQAKELIFSYLDVEDTPDQLSAKIVEHLFRNEIEEALHLAKVHHDEHQRLRRFSGICNFNDNCKESPLVSAIMCTYNRARYITQSIQSLITQSAPFHEIIIVDDGSSDNTASLVADLQKDNSSLLYTRKHNRGVSAARNHGIKKAKGEFIVFLDSDDILLADALFSLLKGHYREPDYDMYYGNSYIVDINLKPIKENVLPDYTQCSGDLFFLENIIGNVLLLCGALIRKSIYEKEGYYDEEMKTAEDREWFLRVSKALRIKYVDRFFMRYRRGHESLNCPRPMEKQQRQHQCYYWNKLIDKHILSVQYKELFPFFDWTNEELATGSSLLIMAYLYSRIHSVRKCQQYIEKSLAVQSLESSLSYIISNYIHDRQAPADVLMKRIFDHVAGWLRNNDFSVVELGAGISIDNFSPDGVEEEVSQQKSISFVIFCEGDSVEDIRNIIRSVCLQKIPQHEYIICGGSLSQQEYIREHVFEDVSVSFIPSSSDKKADLQMAHMFARYSYVLLLNDICILHESWYQEVNSIDQKIICSRVLLPDGSLYKDPLLKAVRNINIECKEDFPEENYFPSIGTLVSADILEKIPLKLAPTYELSLAMLAEQCNRIGHAPFMINNALIFYNDASRTQVGYQQFIRTEEASYLWLLDKDKNWTIDQLQEEFYERMEQGQHAEGLDCLRYAFTLFPNDRVIGSLWKQTMDAIIDRNEESAFYPKGHPDYRSLMLAISECFSPPDFSIC